MTHVPLEITEKIKQAYDSGKNVCEIPRFFLIAIWLPHTQMWAII